MIFSKFFSKKSNALPHSTETVNLQYEKLEPLRVLNADYDFAFTEYSVSEGDVISQLNIVEITRNSFDDAETVEVLLSSGLTNPAFGGDDYGLGPITVDFDIFEISKIVPIEILGDTIVEADETLQLSFGSFSGDGQAGTQSTSTLTILNDDQTEVTLSGPLGGQDEGSNAVGGTLQCTVTLSNAVQGGFSLDFSTDDGTATSAELDYVDNDGIFNFNGDEGESQTIEVSIVGDDVVELDETISVSLGAVTTNELGIDLSNISVSRTPVEATIVNDDASQVSIDDVTVTETDSGTSVAKFTIALDQASDTDVIVEASTFNIGSASDSSGGLIGNNDFVSKTETITFTAGETEKFFEVLLNGDEVVELDEVFEVRLSNLQNGGRNIVISDGIGQGTIKNNDAAIVSINDVTLDEGDVGQTNFTFSVSLDKSVDATVQFEFSTADGTAKTSDADYVAIGPTTRAFLPSTAGATESISVAVNGDYHLEAGVDEVFSVILASLNSNARDVRFESHSLTEIGTGTIVNDDTHTLVQLDATGNLVITDEIRAGFDDEITISFDPTSNEIIVSVGSGRALLGTGDVNLLPEIRIDKDSVLGQIVIDARVGDDLVTIDLSDGNPIPVGGIFYKGGSAGDDGLAIVGKGEVAVYTPSLNTEGNGIITVDGMSIAFSGLEPVDISGMASVTVMLAGADDIIDIGEGTDFFAGGTEAAILVSGSSGGVPIETAALWNNGSVIVDTTSLDGDDAITISGAANSHLNTNLSVVTGKGNDNVTLAGDATFSGKVAIQTWKIELAADLNASEVLLDATSGINQTTGIVSAANLLVDTNGYASLTANNAVSNLAANVAGDFEFTNTRDLLITELTCGATKINGIDVGGDLDLTLADQNLAQDHALTVDGETTIDVGKGTICLACVDAKGVAKNDFVGLVNAIGTSITIYDINDLALGDLTATLDAAFRSGVGGSGRIVLDGDIEVTSTGGQVLLQSDSGVIQKSGKVASSELLLGSSKETDARRGNFILDGSNEIEKIASRIDGSLSLTNTIDVEVADLTFTSATGCVNDVNIIGIDLRGNFDITLADANITQVSGVHVTGTTTANVVDGPDVDGIATGHVCFSGGDSDGDGFNDNDFSTVRVIHATDAEFTDTNNMTVLSANVENQLRFWTGAGIQPDGITPTLGRLTLAGDVNGFRVLLQSSNGVIQTSGGITAEELMLGGDDLLSEGTGDFVMLGPNQITTLTANLDNNLALRALAVFEGGVHTFETDCGTFEFIEGIRVRTLIGVSFALPTSVGPDNVILEPDEPNIESTQPAPQEVSNNAFDMIVERSEQTIIEAELIFIDKDGSERLITKLGKDEITPDDADKWKARVNDGAEFRPGVYRLRWSVGGVPFYIDFEKEVDEEMASGLLSNNPSVDILDVSPSEPGIEHDSAMFQTEAFENLSTLPATDVTEASSQSGEGDSDAAKTTALERLGHASRIISAAALVVALTKNRTKKGPTLDALVDSSEVPVSFLKNARRKRRCTAISS